MSRKTLFYKQLRNPGDTLEVAVYFEKPYRRNGKVHQRGFYFNILPSLWVASTDNYWGGGKYVCQSTIQLSWLFFYIYVETFKAVKGGEKQ